MLRRADPAAADITLFYEGRAVPARAGEPVAAALLAAGVCITRTTAISGAPRGPYCMMGACFDCLAVVDGRGGVQTCMVPAADGMRVARQDAARAIDGDADA